MLTYVGPISGPCSAPLAEKSLSNLFTKPQELGIYSNKKKHKRSPHPAKSEHSSFMASARHTLHLWWRVFALAQRIILALNSRIQGFKDSRIQFNSRIRVHHSAPLSSRWRVHVVHDEVQRSLDRRCQHWRLDQKGTNRDARNWTLLKRLSAVSSSSFLRKLQSAIVIQVEPWMRINHFPGTTGCSDLAFWHLLATW